MHHIKSPNKTNLVITIIVFVLAGLFYSDMSNEAKAMAARISVIENRQLVVGANYSAIDNELALAYSVYKLEDGKVYRCFDLTNAQIVDYYQEYGVPITDFGKLLTLGNYLCNERGSE